MSASIDAPADTSGSATVPLGVAVVGLGWWGTTVASSLADSAVIDVVAGVDPDAGSRDRFGAATGLDTTAELAEVLRRDDVGAVVLCSPHPLHAEQVVLAAEAGRHVFCEKPFTTTSQEARTALDAATRHGVQVGIGHERRFEPAVQEMQRRLASGELGTPLVLEGNFSQDKFLSLPPDNWRLSAELAPAGPLSATGIHLVDLAISMLGRPVEVWARLGTLATSFANGDTLSVTLGFESGATATITAVLTTPFLGRVCLMGSEGWMEIRDRSHPESPSGWDVVLTRRGEAPETRFFPPHPAVKANLEAFASSASGTGDYPVSLSDIQLNVDTFESIVRSARSGRIERV